MSKKVLVLCGGFSAEREVSLISGKGVAEALKNEGYQVRLYDLQNVKDFVKVLESDKPDVVFNALHGNWGEDGEIQALLDLWQIPYTHSGVTASAIGMDKVLTKAVGVAQGLKVAEGCLMTASEFEQKAQTLPMPYVVKPVCDGSSVGVYIIKSPNDLATIKYNADTQLLVERYIAGQELTCAVIDDKAYVVTELQPQTDFYDYHNKYTNGATKHILPAEIPNEVSELCKDYALRIHKALGCKIVSRSDFRYNQQDGVVFLEINTHPGMTPLSLVPEQAKYVGIEYGELCKILVEKADFRRI